MLRLPCRSKPRIPSYRRHKASGQAIVTLDGRDFYLGKFGSKKSKDEYDRLTGEWLRNGRQVLPESADDLLVAELCVAFKRHAKRRYLRDGKPTETCRLIASVMETLGRSRYGSTPACKFGPLALEIQRDQMIAAGHSLRYIRDQVGIIRRAFDWAVSRQLLPASVADALKHLEDLKSGQSGIIERAPVRPVDDEVVDATIPFLPPVVDDMIRLLRLLGCRPGELCDLRPRNVDRSDNVWVYRPERHKTQHRGRERTIFIGPRAQAILAPYLLRDANAFCFSPAESDRRRREALHAERQTPLSYGNRPGTNVKRRPARQPGEKYCHTSINRAVQRACDKADAAGRSATTEAPPDARIVPRWFTYQLRHTAATEFRKRYGLEASQVLLGHSSLGITQVYAERDDSKARAIMAEVG